MSLPRVLLAVVAATGATTISLTAHAEHPTLATVPGAQPVVTIPETQLVAAAVVDAPSTTVTTVAAPTTTRVTAKPRPKGDSKTDENKQDTRPKPPPSGLPLGTPFVGKYTGAEIEGFARYEGQSTCDPTPKSGTVALRDLLLARYPSTASLGVSRACDVGGQSEHKEGRAFDWGADVGNAADVAAVNDFLNALFATDAQGHKFALARRMGIMYVIWNHQIWGAYAANDGWRPYDGDNPHTNHVHISLSWAGARGETSFWSGQVLVPETTTTTWNRHRDRTTSTTTQWKWPTSTTGPTSTTSTTSTTTCSELPESCSPAPDPPTTETHRRHHRG
jgi:hypothetical protein